MGDFNDPFMRNQNAAVQARTKAQNRANVLQLKLVCLRFPVSAKASEFLLHDPLNDPNISGDPYKTLFVARLNYETTESRIKREFDVYGPIKRVGILSPQGDLVRLVTDKETNKPQGYGFIEYVHTRDMKGYLSTLHPLEVSSMLLSLEQLLLTFFISLLIRVLVKEAKVDLGTLHLNIHNFLTHIVA
ncbi:U1 small nuclear ribonucleoprotein 70 kDa [Morus notabilis]|uniref:U1 small nuclear ribonucleoprotein 70 kDa n=1 Tax=Morus notabilis TaxID=981085 RepID=W9SDG3_9ROSA|nr:U1 small nuclear ribonucleoprotein 70 kDa [Morus notabilis]